MATLPIFKTVDIPLSLLQTAWAKMINPVLSQPINSGVILKEVSLTTGDNVINHRLGRKLQGWFIVRQRGPAVIYDNQDSNNQPNLTLLLNASTNVTVDLLVF